MIKTTNPITPDIVFLSVTTSSVTELNRLETIYDNYNNHFLPKILDKVHPEVHEVFFKSETLISVPETEVTEMEVVDDSLLLKIKTVRYNSETDNLTNLEGTMLFTGVKDLQAEFEGSPTTLDYLVDIIQNRILYDVFFDIKTLADGTVEHLIDIYSFNEENYENDEDDPDLDDIETLHIQFKFTGFSFNAEIVQSPEDEQQD